MEHKTTLEQAKAYTGMHANLFEMQCAGRWNPYAFMRDNLREYKVGPGWQQMTAKEYYNNSAIMSIATRIDYIDGYVSVCGLLIRHAWNEADGDAIDFTIRDDCNERAYFGVKFPADVVDEITDSEYWEHAEGLIGALVMMPEADRNRLLEVAGYNPKEVRDES